MSLRVPVARLSKRASPAHISRFTATPTSSLWQRSQQDVSGFQRNLATVPPVTQDATSSKGPTAMVFMNMGGPSTTDEVGDFLSRLFVLPQTYLNLTN